MKRVFRILLAGAAVLVLSEVGLRLSGVADVPLYRPDSRYGYTPLENQTGAFLHRYRWAFNAQGMGVAAPYKPGGVVLISDSVVHGGARMDQSERLGPRLQGLTGSSVWPISADSWGLLNELAWLRANPQVVKGAKTLVFVLNTADFGAPSAWRDGDPVRIRRQPDLVLLYLAKRLLLPRDPRSLATARDWRSELGALDRDFDGRVVVILYPWKKAGPGDFDDMRAGLSGEVLQIGEDHRWAGATYRDPVHVDAGGTALLAQLIAEKLGDVPSGGKASGGSP